MAVVSLEGLLYLWGKNHAKYRKINKINPDQENHSRCKTGLRAGVIKTVKNPDRAAEAEMTKYQWLGCSPLPTRTGQV